MPYTFGLCGSSSVSHLAWCLRWIATHSLVIMPVLTHDQNRKKCASTGWKSTPRCDWLRCRYSVTVKIVSCVTTSRYTIQVPQDAWVRPRAAKASRVSNMNEEARESGRNGAGLYATPNGGSMAFRQALGHLMTRRCLRR